MFANEGEKIVPLLNLSRSRQKQLFPVIVLIRLLISCNSDSIDREKVLEIESALKEIKKYGTWQKTIEAYKDKYADSRKSFPDLKEPLLIKDNYNPVSIFGELKNKKSEKGKIVYPEISFDMSYTGVLNAFDKDLLKIKGVKSEIMALMFENRVRLAYSLKKMDDNIPNLPEIKKLQLNKERVLEYFRYYDITTLDESICIFE